MVKWNLSLTDEGFDAGDKYTVSLMTRFQTLENVFQNLKVKRGKEVSELVHFLSASSGTTTVNNMLGEVIRTGDTAVSVYAAGASETWEMTGIMEKGEDGTGAIPHGFIIKDTVSGKTKKFYGLNATLIECDNWKKYDSSGDYVYNDGGKDHFGYQQQQKKVGYRAVIQDDVFYLWLDGELTWRIPLTADLFGGFEAGSQYRLGISINGGTANDTADDGTMMYKCVTVKTGEEADTTGVIPFLTTKETQSDTQEYLWCKTDEGNGASKWVVDGTLKSMTKHLLLRSVTDEGVSETIQSFDLGLTSDAQVRMVLVKDVLRVYVNGEEHAEYDLTEEAYGGFPEGTSYVLGFDIQGTKENVEEQTACLKVKSGNKVRTLDDIYIVDPFILADEDSMTYYLYGTRYNKYLHVFTSEDMLVWEKQAPCFDANAVECVGEDGFWGDEDVLWAPEVFRYEGAYYMFVTTQDADQYRRVIVLRAESPVGPFYEWSEGGVTPEGHMGLDGTFYMEDGVPYMIYSHEWDCKGCDSNNQTGKIAYIPLTADLKAAAGESKQWFKGNVNVTIDAIHKNALAEGPYVYTNGGKHYLLWSTVVDNYTTYTAVYSEFDKLGDTIGLLKSSNVLYGDDGGHSMSFTDFDGTDLLVLHTPNKNRSQLVARAKVFDIRTDNGKLKIENR